MVLSCVMMGKIGRARNIYAQVMHELSSFAVRRHPEKFLRMTIPRPSFSFLSLVYEKEKKKTEELSSQVVVASK